MHQEQSQNMLSILADLYSEKKITSQEILALQDSFSKSGSCDGEGLFQLFFDNQPISALMNVIKELFNAAKSIHEKNENRPYHITRLSTGEYTFYMDQPLNAEDFEKLLREIEKLSGSYHENLHFLLSSFWVYSGYELNNISIYVTCGKKAKIRLIKKINSDEDSDDSDVDPPTKKDPFLLTKIEDPVFLTNFGDQECYQSIDICADHQESPSIDTLIQKLQKDPDCFIPNQMSFILASYGMALLDWNCPATTSVQADPNMLDSEFLHSSLEMISTISLREVKDGFLKLYKCNESNLPYMRYDIDELRREHNRKYLEKNHYEIILNFTTHFSDALREKNFKILNFLMSLAPTSTLSQFFYPLQLIFSELNSYSRYLLRDTAICSIDILSSRIDSISCYSDVLRLMSRSQELSKNDLNKILNIAKEQLGVEPTKSMLLLLENDLKKLNHDVLCYLFLYTCEIEWDDFGFLNNLLSRFNDHFSLRKMISGETEINEEALKLINQRIAFLSKNSIKMNNRIWPIGMLDLTPVSRTLC